MKINETMLIEKVERRTVKKTTKKKSARKTKSKIDQIKSKIKLVERSLKKRYSDKEQIASDVIAILQILAAIVMILEDRNVPDLLREKLDKSRRIIDALDEILDGLNKLKY